jgi:hypothetical protein
MKLSFVIFFSLCFCSIAEDLTTLDNNTYHDIRVSRIEVDGIIALYSGGGGKIFFTNLPPDLQKRYGYDPAKAAALAARQEKIRKLGRLGAGYRLTELSQAQAEARQDGKPLAFIATKLSLLQENELVTGTGGAAASIHAFEALKNAAVIVFTDAYTENHTQPSLVDIALHPPDDVHYTPPKVVITDPDLTKVIAVVPYTRGYATRQSLLTAALTKIKEAKK